MTETSPFDVAGPTRDCKVCGAEGAAHPDHQVQALMPGENDTKQWRCGHCGESFAGPNWAK